MKFSTTVFLGPVSRELVMPALTAALAPFDYNGEIREPFDPNAVWDRWWLPRANRLPLRPERAGDVRALRVDGDDRERAAVAAPKGIIDFEALRRSARDYAAAGWDAWAGVVRAHPAPLPLAHFEAVYADEPGQAQREWLAQPAVQEVARHAETQEHPYFTFSLLTADPVAVFAGDREHYLAGIAAQAVATYAYVTLDGQWLTQFTDDRGWPAHVREMDRYLDSVPDDCVIASVQCHM
ncbi:hypothetical protein [Actinoplanes sp. NPDC048796]|uniref:hypothetical protein n=1 Tax=Actinoplanes sp. NPDC048796 TaxID=3155640 RepID=UPI0033E41988